MRYRALTASGDYSFGLGPSEFLINTPATVAQAILTGLLLIQGEWFLNLLAGMPWFTQVLGFNTQSLYDPAIKNQILSTQGVSGIASYSSNFNSSRRSLSVQATVNTIYGATTINTVLSVG